MTKRIVLLITALMFAAYGCSGPSKSKTGESSGAETESAKKVFVYDIYSEPEYLDPTLASGTPSMTVLTNLFEGLTDYDPKTLEPVPGVAKSWDISPDGKTYTFHLREDAKWSDGSPVTARDFVYSWQRALDPKTAAKYAYQLYYIKNGEAINKGQIKDLNQLGVKAIDERTLKVELENPTPFFLSITGWYTLRPVKKEVIEKHDRRWTRPENMVGNGYFKLTEWTPQKQIVLEPNPHYWDRKNVHLDQAKFLPIEDQETGLKLFMKGDIHYLYNPPAIKIPNLRKHPEFLGGPELGTYYLLVNTKRPVLNNKKFRQALSYAIDRKQITKLLNQGIPTTSFTPKGTAGYNPPEVLKFDPEKAKQLLAEAGYGEGKQPLPTITIVYNTDERHRMVMEIVQNMWKKHLGLNVKLQNMEWKVLLKTRRSQDYDISRDGWIGDYVDPNTFLDLYMTGGGNNHSGWGNPQYDELIRKAAQTTDQKKRYEYFFEAEKIFLEELPVIPLYIYTRPSMLSNKVEGFYHTLQDLHPLKGVKVKG